MPKLIKYKIIGIEISKNDKHKPLYKLDLVLEAERHSIVSFSIVI